MPHKMQQKVQDNERPFKCSTCPKSFKRSDHLRSHQYVHTRNRPRPHPCTECSYKAPTPAELTRHIERHRKWQKEKCPHCDKYFARPALCQDHIKRVHSTARIACHHCIICDGKFLHRDALNRHTCVHIGERWFPCELCGDMFYTSTEKYSHIRRHHTKEHAHCCKLCKKGFVTQQEVKLHMEIHNTLRKSSHSCDKCEKMFTSKIRLVAHQSRTHASAEIRSRFKCEECGKGFASKQERDRHLQAHENAKNRPYSICLICNIKRRFFSQKALEVHMNIHTGERPYMCSICGSEHWRNVDLSIHGIVHSSNYAFPCRQCPSKFKMEYHLKAHQKTMHSMK